MDKELWCTECSYFRYVVDDMDDSWYGTKCDKDGHEASSGMYAIQSLHDDCPLRNEVMQMRRDEFPIVDKYLKDVLEDIKAEIKQGVSHFAHENGDITYGLKIAESIIDKHIGKGDSEE